MTEHSPRSALAAWRPVAIAPDRNPYLVYIGGLDASSRPTMASAARLIADVVSGGAIDPGVLPWHRLSYGVVKRVRSVLQEREFAPRTINKALTLMRNVAREAWLLKQMPHENYEAILQVENLVSKRLPAGRVVERAEIAALLAVCAADLNGLRDGAIIAVLAGAGLREDEAVRLRRGDFAAATGTIIVRHGKGHKQRQAYMDKALEGPLLKFVDAVPGLSDDPLLPRLAPRGTVIRPLRSISTQAVNKTTERRGHEAGIAPFTPHDLRRSFITFQLERGVDPLRIARAVGHASPKTTMIYDRRTAESDRMAIRGVDGGEK